MPTWTIKGGGRAAGYDTSWDTTVDGGGEQIVNPPLTAGETAVSWTYSSASGGTAVMAANHTIQSADKVDLYWADGYRHGMTATVSGTSVALAGGDGDNCPASDTAVILSVQVAVTLAFIGDNVKALLGSATYRSIVCLVDGSSNVKAFEILPTGGLTWSIYAGLDNPLESFTVVSGTITSTDPISAATEKPVLFGALYDATPSYPG